MYAQGIEANQNLLTHRVVDWWKGGTWERLVFPCFYQPPTSCIHSRLKSSASDSLSPHPWFVSFSLSLQRSCPSHALDATDEDRCMTLTCPALWECVRVVSSQQEVFMIVTAYILPPPCRPDENCIYLPIQFYARNHPSPCVGGLLSRDLPNLWSFSRSMIGNVCEINFGLSQQLKVGVFFISASILSLLKVKGKSSLM